MLPGEEKVYKSIDNICSKDQIINYPTEFLNSLEPTGTAPHNLLLMLGVPIMLLCNCDPPKYHKTYHKKNDVPCTGGNNYL